MVDWAIVRKSLGRQAGVNIVLKTKRQGEPTTLICPKDGGILEAIIVKGITIDCCPDCNGVWFDKGELEKMAHDVTLKTKYKKGKGTMGKDILEGIDFFAHLVDVLAAIFHS